MHARVLKVPALFPGPACCSSQGAPFGGLPQQKLPQKQKHNEPKYAAVEDKERLEPRGKPSRRARHPEKHGANSYTEPAVDLQDGPGNAGDAAVVVEHQVNVNEATEPLSAEAGIDMEDTPLLYHEPGNVVGDANGAEAASDKAMGDDSGDSEMQA